MAKTTLLQFGFTGGSTDHVSMFADRIVMMASGGTLASPIASVGIPNVNGSYRVLTVSSVSTILNAVGVEEFLQVTLVNNSSGQAWIRLDSIAQISPASYTGDYTTIQGIGYMNHPGDSSYGLTTYLQVTDTQASIESVLGRTALLT